jgi:hypothetical protein
MEGQPSPLSSRPERSRVSCFALLATTTGAVSRQGNRMNLINATALDRKSGERSGEISERVLFLGNVFLREHC